MAKFQVEFFSYSLVRPASFLMYIPNDPRPELLNQDNPYFRRPTKTLILLHGYTGAAYFWGVEELANKYNFAFVMPSGENAFYLDGEATGQKHGTYVGKELIEYLRKTFNLAKGADDTYIMGFSMGGFGALHTALSYPENFGKLGAMSMANIVHGIAHMEPGSDNGVANYAYYRNCFGDLETVEERDVNPEVLIRKLKADGQKFPEMYFCCGTEDMLVAESRKFHDFLENENVEHIYKESSGYHDGVFWDEYTKKIIPWMFEEK